MPNNSLISESASRFLLKHSDVDLTSLLDSTVPPIQLGHVAVFRAALQRYEKKAGYCILSNWPPILFRLCSRRFRLRLWKRKRSNLTLNYLIESLSQTLSHCSGCRYRVTESDSFSLFRMQI